MRAPVRNCRYCLALLGFVPAVHPCPLHFCGGCPGAARDGGSLCADWRGDRKECLWCNPFPLGIEPCIEPGDTQRCGITTRATVPPLPAAARRKPFPRGEGGSPQARRMRNGDEFRNARTETRRIDRRQQKLASPYGGGAQCAHWAERALSVKNQRFLPALPEGEPRAARRRHRARIGCPPCGRTHCQRRLAARNSIIEVLL